MGFSKVGYRASVRKMNNRKLKSHMAEFYNILSQLEDLAEELNTKYPNQEVTEKWIKEIAPKEFGRELDSMETIVIASKMWEMQNDKQRTENTVVGTESGESTETD